MLDRICMRFLHRHRRPPTVAELIVLAGWFPSDALARLERLGLVAGVRAPAPVQLRLVK